MKRQIKKNLVNGFLVLATVGTLGTVGVNHVMAYLTDTEATVNTFTVGKVQIDLEETSYPGNNQPGVTNIVPNQVIAKDPKVENTGANDAICFVSVSIPVKKVITAADDGTRSGDTATLTELFKTQSGTKDFGYGVVDDNWILISTKYVDDRDAESDTMTDSTTGIVRTYGYNKKLTTTNTSTEAVFDNVKLANVIEGQVDSTPEDIKVRAAAIQATDIADINTNTLDYSTLTKIYGVYLNQSGKVSDKNAATSNAKDLAGNNRT